MNDLNKVSLIGRVTKDVGSDEYSYSVMANGTAKAQVAIAVNRGEKHNGEWTDTVSYVDVVIWGKLAENLKSYLTKGKQIAVAGFIKQDRWEKDGQKFSKMYVVAEEVELLGGGAEGKPSRAASGRPVPPMREPGQDIEDFPEDEVEF